MRALLIPNFTKERTPQVLREVCRVLDGLGMTAVVLPEAHSGLRAHGCPDIPLYGAAPGELARSCDFILSIGGDGTIIQGAHYAALAGLPIVGVNVGRLGFLAQLEPDRLEEGLCRIRQGQYVVEHRMALAARFDSDVMEPIPFAINDIVAFKAPGTNIVEFAIYYGSRLIDRYAADGIILATPTGSTAYALAAGGPVIDPSLSTISLVPVCPHSIATRPIIFSGDKEISLLCTSGSVQVQADGRSPVLLEEGARMTLGRSELHAGFISFNEYEFFEVLTTKIRQKG